MRTNPAVMSATLALYALRMKLARIAHRLVARRWDDRLATAGMVGPRRLARLEGAGSHPERKRTARGADSLGPARGAGFASCHAGLT